MTPNPNSLPSATVLPTTGTPPEVIAPQRRFVFADRAARFQALAAGHAVGDWLAFLGRLTGLQHDILQAHPALPLPDAAALARAREHHMPPLAVASWPRDPAWREDLHALVAGLRAQGDLSAELVATLDALEAATDVRLEQLADALLRTEYPADAAACLPLVAAALQVYWTHMAAAPELAALPRLDVGGVCPCCGSLPVASVIRTAGDAAGLRYLHCSMCNTEWSMVRVQCPACEKTERVSYRHIEGSSGAARAECCEDCGGYLKLFHQDKDPLLDPVADDLATLALDMLVDEAGFARAGPNPLFIPGGDAGA